MLTETVNIQKALHHTSTKKQQTIIHVMLCAEMSRNCLRIVQEMTTPFMALKFSNKTPLPCSKFSFRCTCKLEEIVKISKSLTYA